MKVSERSLMFIKLTFSILGFLFPHKKICEFLNIKYDKIDYSKERVGNYKEKLGNTKYNELINFFREDIQDLEKLINEKTNWI